MAATVFTAAINGINAELITIETRISPGVQYFIVGLPGESVKESLFRVESALESAGMNMPRQKILICMAPAGLRKEGAAFDLPIAVSILAASGQLTAKIDHILFSGELSLNGNLRPVRGIIAITIAAREKGFKSIIVPKENGTEAAMVPGIAVYAFETLREVLGFLEKPQKKFRVKAPVLTQTKTTRQFEVDFAEIRGQKQIRRAAEIAAAGKHNLLMIGAPGSGKTMIAKRLPTIMPPPDLKEMLETTRIYSISNQLTGDNLLSQRPFRMPHHTASDIAMAGGGLPIMPGEISLAHNGILFLDEFPEFQKRVLEVLRQPLEAKTITISRASYNAQLPADFLLVAAMNPCPCGYFKHPTRKCTCSLKAINYYLRKISGPLLDRIDLQVHAAPIAYQDMNEPNVSEKSADIAARVLLAHTRQMSRQGCHNAGLSPEGVSRFCKLASTEQEILLKALQQYKLSARSHDRILKVARTIADLAQEDHISLIHLAEAIALRCLDHDYFQ